MIELFVSLLVFIAFITIAGAAPLDLFLLNGTVYGRDGQLVYLTKDLCGESKIYCTIVRNNRFRLSCGIDEIIQGYLVFGEGDEQVVYPIELKKGHFTFNQSDH